jgi:hypothetical protein
MPDSIDLACLLLATLPAGTTYYGEAGCKHAGYTSFEGSMEDGGAPMRDARQRLRERARDGHEGAQAGWLKEFHVSFAGMAVDVVCMSTLTHRPLDGMIVESELPDSLNDAIAAQHEQGKLLDALSGWGAT